VNECEICRSKCESQDVLCPACRESVTRLVRICQRTSIPLVGAPMAAKAENESAAADARDAWGPWDAYEATAREA
jgi:predicted amidophosphoribosyltransferase